MYIQLINANVANSEESTVYISREETPQSIL